MEYIQPILEATHNFLAPPPLSPYFQEGGLFYGFNEDLTLIVLGMLLLGIIDLIIVKPFIKPKARYFFLHAVANGIAMCAAWPDVKRGFMSGDDSFNGQSSTMVANSAIAAIHLYHCVAFDLRPEDIFHHVQFVVVLCGLAIPYKQTGGVANNFGCFFLSGLPGGMDYVMLVLVAHGYLSKMDEKTWNARINVWLRGPAMTVYLVLGWQAHIYGTCGDYHCTILFLIVFLHFTNGQYYARQAVESYAAWKERAKVEKAAKKQ